MATKALELGRTLTSLLSKSALTSNRNEHIVKLYYGTTVDDQYHLHLPVRTMCIIAIDSFILPCQHFSLDIIRI